MNQPFDSENPKFQESQTSPSNGSFLIKTLIQVIRTSRPTKGRPRPHHKSKPKPVCTYWKRLTVKETSTHPSQPSNSALASPLTLENRTCSPYMEIRNLRANLPCFHLSLLTPWNSLGKSALLLERHWSPQSMDCFPLNKGHPTCYWIVLFLSYDNTKKEAARNSAIRLYWDITHSPLPGLLRRNLETERICMPIMPSAATAWQVMEEALVPLV